MAKAYRTTNKNGPKWHEVKRRVTVDIDTKQITEDKTVEQIAADKGEHAALPQGVRNIRTILYFDPQAAVPDSTDNTKRGELQQIAARLLMKVLFAARMACFDLLRPVNMLASAITKWTTGCDKALWRLMSYIETTKDLTVIAEVGDEMKDIRPNLYADADFAGCPFSARSTSGVYYLVDPNCFN